MARENTIRSRIAKLNEQIEKLEAQKAELEEQLPRSGRVYGDPLVEMD